ncbi:MAG TPA: PQQ-binding-like beta-propeller repeat protein [Vicinamibacterales bacterium]|nr:PQQ-binding-like beta-propeller repeat protein [Vicinamibacterales bacterium]
MSIRLLSAAVSGAGAIACFAASITAANPEAERYWPQWRGPDGTGASRHATPPLEWSETKNVRWKKEIPGRGAGTPVIWGDRVFLLTAVPLSGAGAPAASPHKYLVMALDRRDGRVLWERVAREEAPHEGTHQEHGTWASPSAVTDGQHVIASFESRGIYAYDMDGKPVWQKDLGDKTMRNQFGEGSTPALHGNTLVVVWDHQGESFIVALDKRTGEERWRAARDEIDSWATPLVVEHGGRAQVVTSGMKQVRSYDLETGKLIWFGDGLTMNPIPSPVAAEGLVILTSGFRGNDLQAVKLAEANGNITGSPAIAWTLDRDTPYVPSPLLYDGMLYLLKSNSGIVSAFDAKTGKPHYQVQRIEAVPNVFASPAAAAGRIYIPGQEGTTVVLRHGPQFEVLATNKLDDGFNASPALVENAVYLRGHRYLYCLAE